MKHVVSFLNRIAEATERIAPFVDSYGMWVAAIFLAAATVTGGDEVLKTELPPLSSAIFLTLFIVVLSFALYFQPIDKHRG